MFADRNVAPLCAQKLRLDCTTDEMDSAHDDPMAELMRIQTEGRHSPAYYKRLRTSTMCACLGGWFFLPLPQREAHTMWRTGRKLLKAGRFPTRAVCQWDSWRMWEAFAAGCAVLHLEFEKHGMMLPIMPTNGEHYIGIDPQHVEESLSVLDDVSRVEQIGARGREWALRHYSPKAIAARCLRLLGMSVPQEVCV
jgi:hypothetical protein